ncbi:hypothetical protein P154DRAFT_569916 [Amniculicola lignicola CBS 123094]|uniref:Uncharacterized protein n=1 Tax=Amniculicola lignicola CBS 123094 TaxID=1392246 RepID=A0A6A5WZB2_9PLEO|nr:hypothetical protein P154DRAFT_569916 [Amniculicola lignicola CBS 123094]
MAAFDAYSPSPLEQQLPTSLAYPFNPSTPVHSPHHSFNSSVSSRTPLHTLTLHEYRKLQNTPPAPTPTPPVNRLRRKAAASSLHDAERAPSVSPVSSRVSRPYRPLQPSHSAYPLTSSQLSAHQSLPPSPPHLPNHTATQVGAFRSKSAQAVRDSRSVGIHHSSLRSERNLQPSRYSPPPEASNWKSTKRLPKPDVDLISPALREQVSQNRRAQAHSSSLAPLSDFSKPWLSPAQTTSCSSSENLVLSGPQSSSSAISLSRFPQPPPLFEPPLSPPNDENDLPRLNISFTTTAPATPPATPAVIHYRGTSFELVNPHRSLLFHEIDSPTREFDSLEYLPLRSSEEPYEDVDAMAPRRPLFSDLGSAHSSITRRAGNVPEESLSNNLPATPDPVVLSPESIVDARSAEYIGQDSLPPTPTLQTPVGSDARFSLKALTRSLTKKISKSPKYGDEGGYELPATRANAATRNLEGSFPRPLDYTYRSTGEDYPQFSSLRYSSAPLTSMVPEAPSVEEGRAGGGERLSVSMGDFAPGYYDNSSLYAASSVYSYEHDGSGYPTSLYSRRRSNPFGPLFTSSEPMPGKSNRDSTYSYRAPSNPYSRRHTQDLHPLAEINKTDTISKFIDVYGRNSAAQGHAPLPGMNEPSQSEPASSGLSQFEFNLQSGNVSAESAASLMSRMMDGPEQKPTITQAPGSPPHTLAPAAPPILQADRFNMPRRSEPSDMFSAFTSYGDTRHLLQLPHSPVTTDVPAMPARTLEPSSSYSQPEGPTTPQTPQAALDQAEEIFEQMASNAEGGGGIPAMWTRRSSGNLLHRTQHPADQAAQESVSTGSGVQEEERGDWETIGNPSQGDVGERPSLDESFADYSSSDQSRDSLGMAGDVSLPVLQNEIDRTASLYRHPSPLPTHEHPFSSSPPPLRGHANTYSAPDGSLQTPRASSPPLSSTAPLFRGHEPSYQYRPFVRPYEMSDKETQELLNSGPNEEILYEDPRRSSGYISRRRDDLSSFSRLPEYSSGLSNRPEPPTFGRENTFEKITYVGPKGNLTGTPHGTGMKEAGSSVADNSSPGVPLSSISTRRQAQGFYASPTRTSSITRIRSSSRLSPSSIVHERSPSDQSLFPRYVPDVSSPLSGKKSKRSSNSRSLKSPRRSSRAAVPGQTRLREMVLAPDAQTISSGHSTHFSQFMMSDRPSSSNTNTPLRGTLSVPSLRTDVAKKHSPHLLCPERATDPEEERERLRKSWIIFAIFALLPPVLILYRWWGDRTMVYWTKGQFGHCAWRPKQIALYAGVSINLGSAVIIVAAVMWSKAAGAL